MATTLLRRRRAAATAGAGCMVIALGTAIAVLEHLDAPAVDVPFILVSLLVGAAFAAAGSLLLAVRPGNWLGPLLYVVGTSLVVEFALREYAFRGLRSGHSWLPWPEGLGWAGMVLGPLFFPVPLAMVLFLFPDGRMPTRRWWPVPVASLVVVSSQVVLAALRPGPLLDESYGYPIPWRGALPPQAAAPIAAASETLNRIGILILAVSTLLLIARYMRADPVGRQRLKPLAIAASVAVVSLAVQSVPALRGLGVFTLVIAVAIGFPAALAIGALRYRLWDLDPILVTTIVYGLLAAVITAVYVGAVVAVAALTGTPASPPALLPAIAATSLIAVMFAPVKERITWTVRRMMYGVRASPYEALAALSHQLSDTPVVEEVLPRTADALARGLGTAGARVQAFLADEPYVVWSPRPPADPDPPLVIAPVRHLGQLIGDIAVQPWPDRPLTSADHRLLADLAAQAGPALRAVALTAELQARLEQITAQADELRASRQRIVAAQTTERQRLERDMHDGAQQRLINATVGIQAAERLIASDPDAGRNALHHCYEDLRQCLDDLRELAHGIYPPVLATLGLPAALRARARGTPDRTQVRISATVEARRPPADVELAVYFTCLEAMQNAAKHAPGATVTIELTHVDNALMFTVADNGPGFDHPGRLSGLGIGLLTMADRIGAVGGTLSIESTVGHGTTIHGSVPATPRD